MPIYFFSLDFVQNIDFLSRFSQLKNRNIKLHGFELKLVFSRKMFLDFYYVYQKMIWWYFFRDDIFSDRVIFCQILYNIDRESSTTAKVNNDFFYQDEDFETCILISLNW